MASDKKKKSNIIIGLLSFCVPVFITFLAFHNVGIYPGSENLVLTYDLKTQLLPLYGYISNGAPGFDNLFYSMTGCLGSGFFGTLALYISPFDLIYCFIPLSYLADAVYFMIIVIKFVFIFLFLWYYLLIIGVVSNVRKSKKNASA